ncbi:MAG: TM2 domain-containing protein [Pyrinomonadaceae bacterium]|nr:TM2 domain-containing protein [Pyrinomonadaceae bacterium]
MAIYCPRCNAQNADTAQVCYVCQSPLTGGGAAYQPVQQAYGSSGPPAQQIPGADKKVIAGILGIVAGGFGVHKFILGYTTEGIIQIVLTFITCGIGSIIGLVEGIIYLTKSDEEFVRTYIQNKKGWF